MKNKFLDPFNKIFVLFFFPSFITGVFLPNLMCGLFIFFNLCFNLGKLKNILLKYRIPSFLFILFYISILFSSILSDHLTHSLESSALYFLFIIYSSSIIIIFKDNKDLRLLFFICGITTCIILSIDAVYEFFNGSNILGFSSIDGRLAGLFGTRWVLGRYLIYILPILVGLYFLENDYFKKFNLIIFPTFVLSSLVIIFSGERAAFLMFFLYLFLIFIYFINKLTYKKLVLLLIPIIFLFIFPFFISETSDRIRDNFLIYLTSSNYDVNQYLSMYVTSWKMFLDNPLLGVGPNNFRFECLEELYNVSKWSCSTHPHSIFFQVLAEIGLIGFSAVFSVFSFFLYKSILLVKSKHFHKNSLGIYSLQCSIIIYLFPLMITGNFFLSWYGYIFYLPISLFMVYSDKQENF